MKAYRLDGFANFDHLRLTQEPDRPPQRGELLIRVRAVSLNYRDIAMIKGTYPRAHKAGLIPTSDGAGEVVSVGEEVDAFKPGDRVIGAFHPRWFGGPMHATIAGEAYGDQKDGWLVEYKTVSQEAVVRFPDSISFEEASTLPCAGLTAWTALGGPVPTKVGSLVLVLGTGGVSIFALQLALAAGARVIATTSSDTKGKRLLEFGASHVVNYSQVKDWGRNIRELTNGRGVDKIVEVGGPGTIEQSLKAIAVGGEIASVGFLSTENPGIDFFQLKLSGASFRNIAVGDRAGLIDLVNVISQTGLKPQIDRVFDFDFARDAYEYFSKGAHFGKVVIRIP